MDNLDDLGDFGNIFLLYLVLLIFFLSSCLFSCILPVVFNCPFGLREKERSRVKLTKS